MIRNGLYGLIYSNLWVFVKRMRFQATGDINKISQISSKYIYVDGTPTPAKIQISHSIKVGQFYIDVYSIGTFKMKISTDIIM